MTPSSENDSAQEVEELIVRGKIRPQLNLKVNFARRDGIMFLKDEIGFLFQPTAMKTAMRNTKKRICEATIASSRSGTVNLRLGVTASLNTLSHWLIDEHFQILNPELLVGVRNHAKLDSKIYGLTKKSIDISESWNFMLTYCCQSPSMPRLRLVSKDGPQASAANGVTDAINSQEVIGV
ncbi:hypothetical protein BDY19DRAFT_906617 [Irpex rosettiformis]|uniref:Uncharacterized protein n=1 Tax=Irpex rosettiformis TaxID=378272 RepID=A0ACB8U3E7_9APHY|nr:hypothetical protein BDY19DRAFT_906617 [Irpex rosettiformis]